MRTIRAAITMLILAVPVCAAPAATPDLSAVLASTRQRIETSDFRASGKLVHLGASGTRTSYPITMKGHWFPDGLRLLCEITGPAAARTRLLLHMSVAGHVTIDVMQPGSKVASPLPFERWNEPVMGTDFSYEDMVESQYFWKSQELLPPAKYGARDCFVLKSVPGAQERSTYESVTSSIDHDIFFPVHVVKTVRGTGQQKEFASVGLRQMGGVWSASQVVVTVQGKPGSSTLMIERGSPKAKLDRKDFDLNQPAAPAQGEP